MKKKIFIGIGVGFLAIVVIAVVVVGLFLGDIVKAGMETVGPKVTQTELKVDSVKISALTGAATINGLILGNPDEYKAKAPNAITVGKAAVSVAPLSVLSGKIVIKSVEVREPSITFEGNPLGANNLKKIMDNVNAFTAGLTGGPSTNAAAKPVEKQPGKKLEVDDFLITGAKVQFNGATLPLPDIHLQNLGTGPDGITPAALVQEVLGQVTKATLQAVGESLGKLGKGATDAVGNEASKIGKSITDLFKK